ncbi:hypothetical protein L2E82_31185 [Cichorium intybus]|uniref:Uncharacterized protein n=1 Tax=Cichorium intybus TaxID=13427 RepID=A0ACB9D2C3_CICIN|nr:hypothetical protein L2E82_31185 [Cichorium intybus]
MRSALRLMERSYSQNCYSLSRNGLFTAPQPSRLQAYKKSRFQGCKLVAILVNNLYISGRHLDLPNWRLDRFQSLDWFLAGDGVKENKLDLLYTSLPLRMLYTLELFVCGQIAPCALRVVQVQSYACGYNGGTKDLAKTLSYLSKKNANKVYDTYKQSRKIPNPNQTSQQSRVNNDFLVKNISM